MSKGRILADVLERPGPLYLCIFVIGLVTALLTAVYVFRLFFVAFFATPADGATMVPTRDTRRLLWPLPPLAVLSLLYGLANPPEFLHLGHWLDSFLAGTAMPNPPEVELLAPLVEILDACLALTGLWLAWALYSPVRSPQPGRGRAFAAGLGLDAAYRRFLVAPTTRLANFLWRGVDVNVLDGLPAALASGTVSLAEGLRTLTTGRVSVSLTALLAAAAAVMTWLALGWT